jgi:hypothetical protein
MPSSVTPTCIVDGESWQPKVQSGGLEHVMQLLAGIGASEQGDSSPARVRTAKSRVLQQEGSSSSSSSNSRALRANGDNVQGKVTSLMHRGDMSFEDLTSGLRQPSPYSRFATHH